MNIEQLREQMQEQLKQDDLAISEGITNFLGNFSSGEQEQYAARMLLAEGMRSQIEALNQYIKLLESDTTIKQ